MELLYFKYQLQLFLNDTVVTGQRENFPIDNSQSPNFLILMDKYRATTVLSLTLARDLIQRPELTQTHIVRVHQRVEIWCLLKLFQKFRPYQTCLFPAIFLKSCATTGLLLTTKLTWLIKQLEQAPDSPQISEFIKRPIHFFSYKHKNLTWKCVCDLEKNENSQLFTRNRRISKEKRNHHCR